MRWKPDLTLLGWPKTRGQIVHGLGEPSAIVLLKERDKIMIPTDILLCDQGTTQPSSKKLPPSIDKN